MRPGPTRRSDGVDPAGPLYRGDPMAPGSPRTTRRQFLAGVAGARRGVAARPVSSAGSRAPAAATSRGTGVAFPRSLRGIDGRLEVTLRAEPVGLPYEGAPATALAYNGSVPGPTLRVRPGDRLVVHLENGLDRGTEPAHARSPRPPAADDVFTVVPRAGPAPTSTTCPPPHPPGLFWYHPSRHTPGWPEHVRRRRLAGMLVVDEPDPTVLAAGLATRPERLPARRRPAIGRTAAALAVTPTSSMRGVVRARSCSSRRAQPPARRKRRGRSKRWRILQREPVALLPPRPSTTTLLVRIGSDQGSSPTPETRDEPAAHPGGAAPTSSSRRSRAGRFPPPRAAVRPWSPQGVPRPARHARAPVLATLERLPARRPGTRSDRRCRADRLPSRRPT